MVDWICPFCDKAFETYLNLVSHVCRNWPKGLRRGYCNALHVKGFESRWMRVILWHLLTPWNNIPGLISELRRDGFDLKLRDRTMINHYLERAEKLGYARSVDLTHRPKEKVKGKRSRKLYETTLRGWLYLIHGGGLKKSKQLKMYFDSVQKAL